VTNLDTMSPYLGRILVISIIPTVILLAGLALGVRAIIIAIRRGGDDVRSHLVPAFLSASILLTLAGYFWFIVSYPSETGDTIRAAYMLQIYPPMAVLAGWALLHAQRRWPRLFLVALCLLLAATIHNAGAFFTRYA
jgi:drug/metabolite transporter (DMT)-like permease